MPYRIVHIADVHLDTAFRGLDPALGAARRKQLEDAFERALTLARERRADALCIAGDLYESGRASPDRGAYIGRVLGAIAPTRVFISPGNHDPFDAASLYRQGVLPPNVTVFSKRAFSPVELADGLTLWGAAHEFALDRNPMLNGLTCEGSGTHLLLFHGSDRDHVPPGKECIAPFVDADVARAGAAHAMVGHYHGQLSGAHYAYPGSPEPLNAAQDGRHTAALITVDRGALNVEFVDLNRTRYVSEDLDVSEIADRAALAGAIHARLGALAKPLGEIFCRVRLVGNAPASLDLDIGQLQRECAARYPGATLEDTAAAIDPHEVAREGHTVRAKFARDMLGRIAVAEQSERHVLQLGLRYGLQAFAGKRLAP